MVVIASILFGAIAAAPASAESFHARFEPSNVVEGPGPIFGDVLYCHDHGQDQGSMQVLSQ